MNSVDDELATNGTIGVHDLVDAIRGVLQSSDEPMTIPRIRERLPAPYEAIRKDELQDVLHRQVAAHVLVMCPKYRSGQDRYWDRELRDHAMLLLHKALEPGPTSWSDLRKKLPKYLRHFAESVLNEELAKGAIHRHPPATLRMGPRYAHQPPNVRCYARKELHDMLTRLEQCGFTRSDARETLMALLQEEEWSERN
jgi:hypothetical protein